MSWPQITYLGLLFLCLGISLSQHGQTKNEEENFWITLIGYAINLVILYYGVFFTGGACH